MNTQQLLEMDEKLVKAELEMLSKLDNHSMEKVDVTIKTNESLSADKFVGPLKVFGRMLGVGRFKEKYYTAEELKKAAQKYNGRIIPIKLDHKINESSATIGVVDKVYWMEQEQAIGFEGHINDETHARNTLDGAHTQVSASINSIRSYNEQLGIVGLDLEFPELSIVESGAYPGNYIKPAV